MRVMFLGHYAVGLAARRAAPSVSLGAWFLAAQFVDLIWPAFLLAGVERVRIEPGVTAFTPLDFVSYPVTHSLVGGLAWGAVLAGAWLGATAYGGVERVGARRSNGSIAALLVAVVLSHWVLDVLSHRPDVPVLPNGPLVGLGLWHSVAGTLGVELALFAAGLLLYIRSGAPGRRRASFWMLIGLLVTIYAAVAFGPPPPDVRTLALSGLLLWLFVPLAWFADREP